MSSTAWSISIVIVLALAAMAFLLGRPLARRGAGSASDGSRVLFLASLIGLGSAGASASGGKCDGGGSDGGSCAGGGDGGGGGD